MPMGNPFQQQYPMNILAAQNAIATQNAIANAVSSFQVFCI